MRVNCVKDGDKILDCYHGNGIIWDKIKGKKRVEVIGIEKEKGKGSIAIYGKCEKVIPHLDLSVFNIIDCDAYGIPYKALEALFFNKTLKDGTVIFYTFIQSVLGRSDTKMFWHIGISKIMLNKCPTLFSKIAFDCFKEFLRRNGVNVIYDAFYHDGTSRKHYGYFIYRT
jgi:hypothetical protein